MTIHYRDIPKFCDRVDKDKRTTVILNRYQAYLFKKLTRNRLTPMNALLRSIDGVGYACLVACVLLSARNLLLLSYFRRHNDSRDDLIDYRDLEGGGVAVTFNPAADQMVWED